MDKKTKSLDNDEDELTFKSAIKFLKQENLEKEKIAKSELKLKKENKLLKTQNNELQDFKKNFKKKLKVFNLFYCEKCENIHERTEFNFKLCISCFEINHEEKCGCISQNIHYQIISDEIIYCNKIDNKKRYFSYSIE